MNYPIGTLGDLAKIEMGQSPRGETVSSMPIGLPLLNGPTEFGVQHPSPAQWSEAGVRFARAGDVLFCVRGSTTGRMNLADQDYAIGRGLAALRSKHHGDSRIVKYALDASLFELLAGVTGSVFPNLSRNQILRHPVPVPPLAHQQAIAEVLGALDDKIAANSALISRADQLMHQTWAALTATSRAPLSSTADFINGKAFTKGATGSGRVVVRIAELNSGISGTTVYSDAEVPDRNLVRPGDILFAWSGSLTLHRWFRDEAIVNQHIFKVIPRAEMPVWAVYELIRQKLDDFKTIAADKATTMGHIQRHHLDELVLLPCSESIVKVHPLMDSLWGTAFNAERESLTLATLRDAILPQLMSGALRVRDAEKIAADAGV